jgi:Flp pilus assembly protein TadG
MTRPPTVHHGIRLRRGASLVAGRWRRAPEAGSVSIEVAILAPVLLLLLVVGIAAGRTTLAASAVADAAHDAARAASLARTAAQARGAAVDAAHDSLSGQGVACGSMSVVVDTSGFARPVGQPAAVTVRVSCTVSYADLAAVPGVPGAKTMSASFTSALDTYRSRT